MLQDVESGRAIEVDALLGSVIELARMAEVATPHLDAIYAVDETARPDADDAKGRLAHRARLRRGIAQGGTSR